MTSQRMQWSRCLLLLMMLILTSDVTNDAMAVPVQRSRMPASLTDICDVACSSGDWCPIYCPEHTLFSVKRFDSDMPFSGQLSFDEYLFLKMMGRVRK